MMRSATRDPVIAIVGRPNVGKSTLFNRLVGRRKAVVSTTRGTTRDRLDGQTVWRDRALTLRDTGGMELAATTGMAEAVQRHVWRALQDADAVLFVCDAQEGLVSADELIMERLRKAGKPIVLAVNKADHRLAVAPEFFELGVAQAFAVSALHGLGTGALLDHLVEQVRWPDRSAGDSAVGATHVPGLSPAITVAIVGRQNVGKSSLLNALLREERVIVTEIPGTTRDAVDTPLTVNGEQLVLIDTAGLRHRRKVTQPVDTFSMSRTVEAITRCDVALVVLDATQGVTRDDRRILARVCQAGCGLVILVNKWDLLTGTRARQLADAVRRNLRMASFAPVLAVSAKTGFQVSQSLATSCRLVRTMREGVSAADCLTLLQQAWNGGPPPRVRGRAIRLHQVRWHPGRPARVELVTSPMGRLPQPYQHYLLKCLHAHPRLSGIPIELVVRGPGPR